MPGYSEVEQVKIILGIKPSDTSENTRLQYLNERVKTMIDEWCGRSFGSTTYTEIYMGNGKPYLALNQRPVTAVASVYQDDLAYWGTATNAFGSSTLLTSGVDYALVIDQPDGSSRCGMLFAINGSWSEPFSQTRGIITPFLGPAVGNIKVTYTAGYSVVPAAIIAASDLQIAYLRGIAAYGRSVASESYEEFSASFEAHASQHVLTPHVRSILAKYRNAVVA